ncbi:putative porin [Shewanella sp. GutDb-MelDb]|uniref:putative porin n=1 Tax=Shewanella sp. GutDb-MelDb TaxID=2058316 RepID=UPI000C7BFB32|nr:putative porin [Shewanella sp. GutDb-MelDb]PKG58583.1 hypothetical protein CXF82_03595 [Shewanella sp. GutDb-MelDb]
MNKKTLSLAVLLALVATSANANDNSSNTYQHEANVTFGSHTDNFDNGLWSLDYRFYFSPVDTDNGPYALNGFLAQESNLGAQYAQIRTLDNSALYRIDGTYVINSKWFVAANYNEVDFDDEGALIISLADDMSEYGFSLGYYFNPTSEFSLSYQAGSASGSSSFDNDIYSHSASSESDNKKYSAQVHSFVPLASFSGLDFLAKWSYIDSSYDYSREMTDKTSNEIIERNYQSKTDSDNNIVNLTADWYITKSWSVGAGYLWGQYDTKSHYVNPDGDYQFSHDDSNSSYSISTSYWWQISQLFAANFSAAKQFGLDGDNTPDGFAIGASINGRF